MLAGRPIVTTSSSTEKRALPSFSMERMLSAPGAKFLELNASRIVTPILLCRISALSALCAGKRDYRAYRSLCHVESLILKDLGNDTSADGQTTLANSET